MKNGRFWRRSRQRLPSGIGRCDISSPHRAGGGESMEPGCSHRARRDAAGARRQAVCRYGRGKRWVAHDLTRRRGRRSKGSRARVSGSRCTPRGARDLTAAPSIGGVPSCLQGTRDARRLSCSSPSSTLGSRQTRVIEHADQFLPRAKRSGRTTPGAGDWPDACRWREART